MPTQVTRLVITFIVFVGLFLFVRHQIKPKSHGDIGHYRAKSLEENEQRDIWYAGTASCVECHEDIATGKADDLHKNISCESCHGPGSKHVESMEAADIEVPGGREFCGLCHNKNSSRPADVIKQVDLKEHNVDKDCKDCHNPHKPWDLKE